MKKIILGFILGIIFSGGIVYAYVFYAKDISYDNTNSNLKDTNNNDITNIQDAVDVLYSKSLNNKNLTITIPIVSSTSCTAEAGTTSAAASGNLELTIENGVITNATGLTKSGRNGSKVVVSTLYRVNQDNIVISDN